MCGYHHTGLSWAEALCLAQRDLLKNPTYADVLFWAPYQLFGAWR
jgi:CHAT domain-containing protein